MLNIFGSLANIVAFNVGFNVSSQCRLVILSGNQFSGLINPEIACKRIVVMSINQLRLNNLRDVREVSILEHSHNIFSSFRKLYSPQSFCLIVVALQIWGSWPHGFDTDIVRILVGYFAFKVVP